MLCSVSDNRIQRVCIRLAIALCGSTGYTDIIGHLHVLLCTGRRNTHKIHSQIIADGSSLINAAGNVRIHCVAAGSIRILDEGIQCTVITDRLREHEFNVQSGSNFVFQCIFRLDEGFVNCLCCKSNFHRLVAFAALCFGSCRLRCGIVRGTCCRGSSPTTGSQSHRGSHRNCHSGYEFLFHCFFSFFIVISCGKIT